MTFLLNIENTCLLSSSNKANINSIIIGVNILDDVSINALLTSESMKKYAKNIDAAFPNHENI